MIMEWLKAVEWDHPGIVGPVAAALTIGLLKIIPAIIKRKRRDGAAPNITTTVNPDITVAPQTKIENKPSNVFKPTIGLDEKAVGQEVSKALDPHSARIEARIQALSEQMAAQLAPKQPVPDSGDPLKVKAIEFYNAGVEAHDEGEIGRATGHWIDALQLDPHFANAHYNLGVALHIKGSLDAAIEHWSAAVQIDLNFTQAQCNLGAALAAKGELDAAIELYNAALQIEPDDAVAHFNLGCALAQKKDAAAAVTALAKAMELDPAFRDKAKHEADFDSIRDDPAFRKLVYGE